MKRYVLEENIQIRSLELKRIAFILKKRTINGFQRKLLDYRMISSKTYVKDATVGDIILDDEENILMIALENSEDDYIMAIDENGCLKTIDLDCNCYEKIGTYALIGDIIDQLSKVRKEMEEQRINKCPDWNDLKLNHRLFRNKDEAPS